MTQRASPKRGAKNKAGPFHNFISDGYMFAELDSLESSLWFPRKTAVEIGLSVLWSVPPGTSLQGCELKLIAPFSTCGAALGWERTFDKIFWGGGGVGVGDP